MHFHNIYKSKTIPLSSIDRLQLLSSALFLRINHSKIPLFCKFCKITVIPAGSSFSSYNFWFMCGCVCFSVTWLVSDDSVLLTFFSMNKY